MAAQWKRCRVDPEFVKIGDLIVRLPSRDIRRVEHIHLHARRPGTELMEWPVECNFCQRRSCYAGLPDGPDHEIDRVLDQTADSIVVEEVRAAEERIEHRE